MTNKLLFFMVILFAGCNFSNSKFKSSLKGEIVFTKRGNDEILDLYVISANGTNLRLLFENHDRVNSNILYPYWADLGDKIFFTAMQNGTWKRWEISKLGKNPKVLEGISPVPGFSYSREEEIEMKGGSVYFKGNMIFRHILFNPKFNMGAYEASLSPDRSYIVFVYKNDLWVVDIEGQGKANISKGREPDWKY